MKKIYPSQKERCKIFIRRKTKKVLDEKAKKAGMSQIDYIDKIVL